MSLLLPWVKAQNWYRRKSASLVARKPLRIPAKEPVVSFTFDDFPASSLEVGGAILTQFGHAGTYYVSLGLLGQDSPSGRIVDPSGLSKLVAQGHELGCHTFGHYDSWLTKSSTFEDSILRNRDALAKIVPGVELESFSYPISLPRPATKMRVARHFLCCRAGGQTFNAGITDLNQLSAYFLEKSRDDLQAIRDMIDRNRAARGWLIFATHDISENPSPYGCKPEVLREAVRYAVASGARILPVVKALDALQAASDRKS